MKSCELRRRIGLLAFGAALIVSPAAAGATGTPPAPPASPAAARLITAFQLAGRVTVAVGVRGEHTGERVLRTWSFSSPCASGPCQTVELVRARGGGTDRLALRQLAPGYYVGDGSFYAPLRCGTRTYRRGELAPFKITVRVTSAVLFGNVVVATGVHATYTNKSRNNLTPCVAALGHDAASYDGGVIPTSPSGGGPLSARSPAGS